jgi:3-oxoacyl-[acyl-carrier protein] reductase
MRLEGKIAIVTGAAGGFGEEIALRFAAEGARVAVVDLREEAAERVAGVIGRSAIAIKADVGAPSDVANVVARTQAAFGAVPHILVNNAGTTYRNQPLLNINEEEFDRVFRVNVKSIFHFVHALVPQMRDAGGGVILNIGSTAGIRPRPGLTWYNASKGAVNLMSKSLAVELAPWKIRVNALCPVMGETGLLEAFMGVPDTTENRAKFITTIPLGRLCRPKDLAAAALYLASEEADFITGIELPVDGGRTI